MSLEFCAGCVPAGSRPRARRPRQRLPALHRLAGRAGAGRGQRGASVGAGPPPPRRTPHGFWRYLRLGLPVPPSERPRCSWSPGRDSRPRRRRAASALGAKSRGPEPAPFHGCRPRTKWPPNGRDPHLREQARSLPTVTCWSGPWTAAGSWRASIPADGQGCSVPLPGRRRGDRRQHRDRRGARARAAGGPGLARATLLAGCRRCRAALRLGAPLPDELLSKGVHATRLVLPKRPGTDR